MAKVLVVTDYSGNLHITPLGNKSYYQAQNAKIKTKQFGLQEMDEKEAIKLMEDNNGIDPKFRTPTQAAKVIDDKDAELNRLREQLKQKDEEEAKLRELLSKASTGATDKGSEAAVVNDTTGKGQSTATGKK